MLVMLAMFAFEHDEQDEHYARDARDARFRFKRSWWAFWDLRSAGVICILSYDINLRLTLDFLLRFSSRKPNLSFFMSSRRIIRNFILRKRNILKRADSNRLVMRSCENYNHLKKKYRVNIESDKCIECIRLKRKCDLTFSMMTWKRVKNERDRVLNELKAVHRQMQKTMIKITRLQI